MQLGGKRGKNYGEMISDQEVCKTFTELSNFSADDDRQLMKCIDKYISNEMKDKELNDVSASDFDFKKFDLKNEKLKQLSKELLIMRSDLFLKFTRQFMKASEQLNFSGKVKPGTMAHNVLKCKNLALNAAKNKVFETVLEMMDNTGGCPRMSFNRNKASVFAVDKKVDHEGTTTMFGQAFQQVKAYDPNYGNFRQRGDGARCWRADF